MVAALDHAWGGANLYEDASFDDRRLPERASGRRPFAHHRQPYRRSISRRWTARRSRRVVQCVFQDWKNGAWKVISFQRQARAGADGAGRYRAAGTPRAEGLRLGGLRLDEAASSADKLVFRRKQ